MPSAVDHLICEQRAIFSLQFLGVESPTDSILVVIKSIALVMRPSPLL